ncbi:MAG TPA: hypothetical protein VKB90_05355 [Candidatus Acidoferrum sp.]|nr:hypothetical protein [Candidatus Acidoferrum sp.]
MRRGRVGGLLALAPYHLNLLTKEDAGYAESGQLLVRRRNSSPSAKVWDFSDWQ